MFDPVVIYEKLRPYLINPSVPQKSHGERIWSYCPAHNDGKSDNRMSPPTRKGGRSLSLSKLTGVHCFAGCSYQEIIDAFTKLGYRDDAPAAPRKISSGRPRQLVATYEYRDTDGTLIAIKGRFVETEGGEERKTFAWKLPAEDTWSGLKFGIESLPLYNAHLLSQHPEDIVFFVEGEKAADSCTKAGLLAVCAGGGAQRQPKISNALSALRGRKVALWPDNDDIGRVYMRTVKAMLSGIAEEIYWISVPVPDKGDAYDYFDVLGGTVENIYGTLAKPKARLLSEDSLEIDYPLDGSIAHVILEHIAISGRELDTNLSLELSGKKFSQRINLLSMSSRQTLARELKSYYGDHDWSTFVIDLCNIANDHVRASNNIIDIVDVVVSQRREMLIKDFIPLGEASIIFGSGDAGKTYLCLYTALIVSIGGQFVSGEWVEQSPVLWIDYETQRDGRTVRYRMDRLARGIGINIDRNMIFYKAGAGLSIPDQIDTISSFVRSEGIGLIVIDSALKASGGDVRNELAVARYFSAIQSLGITTITLAHTTKDENTDVPFGSIFWHNEPHGYIWHVTRNSSDPSESILILNNKKANDGRKPQPFGVKMQFSDPDGEIIVSSHAIDNATAMAMGKSRKTIISEYVRQAGEATIEDIASATGISKTAIQNTLTTFKSFFSENGGKTWQVKGS